jgi:hypothetical protein
VPDRHAARHVSVADRMTRAMRSSHPCSRDPLTRDTITHKARIAVLRCCSVKLIMFRAVPYCRRGYCPGWISYTDSAAGECASSLPCFYGTFWSGGPCCAHQLANGRAADFSDQELAPNPGCNSRTAESVRWGGAV